MDSGGPSAINVTFVEHEHAVGDAHHHLHVVLDKEEGEPAIAPQLLDPIEQALAERRVDPRHRLVEQDHLGVGHQHAAEFEELALTARQRAGILVGEPARC